VVRGDEKEVAFLLAGLIDLANSLVGSGNTNDSGLVDTSVSNHVRGCEVVHDEFEFALRHSLAYLLCYACSAHLRCFVVGSNTLVRGNEILLLITSLEREDLLNSSIEEERDVSILLSLRNVDLVYSLRPKSLCENIAHVLRLEGNGKWVVQLVLGHCSKGDILGVGEVLQRRPVHASKQLSDFSDTIRPVVKEEYLITICAG
jgi:hypothetical protein